MIKRKIKIRHFMLFEFNFELKIFALRILNYKNILQVFISIKI